MGGLGKAYESRYKPSNWGRLKKRGVWDLVVKGREGLQRGGGIFEGVRTK